eukprot:6197108-Pleurochrysis_carterae.AAC.6
MRRDGVMQMKLICYVALVAALCAAQDVSVQPQQQDTPQQAQTEQAQQASPSQKQDAKAARPATTSTEAPTGPHVLTLKYSDDADPEQAGAAYAQTTLVCAASRSYAIDCM